METKNDKLVSTHLRYQYISKLIKIIIAVALLLAMIFFTVPYIVTLAPVREQITAKLSSAIGGQIEAKNISWSWLPSPRLVINDTKVSNAMVEADLSGASVRLNLSTLLPGKPQITLELLNPDIEIKTLQMKSKAESKASGEKEQMTLPPIVVAVKNGHIRLPSDGFLKNLAGHEPPLEIFDLDAEISITPTKVDIRTLCRLTFIEKLNAHVSFEKRTAAGSDNSRTYWNLDINGETVNLTEAVEKVMLLFGTHRTASLVCGIVRGGRARSGGYAFQGYTEDFKKLGNMRIVADPTSAVIRVPGVDLHLVDAKGPIKIENGVLTGENLSATLGNSYGKNCSLNLGLVGKNRDFNLALDLDADISELPLLLKKNLLKNNRGVIDELDHIKRAKGRAKAKLIIGDKLKQMAVRVIILDSNNRVVYDRFEHPAGIKRGTLDFYPDSVAWSEVSGTIGPHVIHDARGTVFWKDGVRLDIKNVDAGIQSGVLLKELNAWPVVRKELSPLVRSIQGPVEVSGLQLEGSVKKLEDLEYDLKVSAANLDLDTPLLPGVAHISDAFVHVGKRIIEISDSTVGIADQNLKIKMDLIHNSWKGFSGGVEVQGNIDENLARWIKEKGWIPPPYFPSVPCRLEPMKVAFGQAQILVAGNLVTPLAQNEEIHTAIELGVKEGKIALENLTISSPEEKASLWIRKDRLSERSLDIGFHGSLKSDTVSLVLEENNLLSGNISGDFKLKHFFDQPNTDRFNGRIEISGFAFDAGNNRIGINQAKIIGHESTLTFRNTSLALNEEEMLAEGWVELSANEIVTDLKVRSDYLSAGNLKEIYQSFAESKPGKRTRPGNNPNAPEAPPGLSVRGTIDFDCKQFEYSPEAPKKSNGKAKYIWDNLSGKIELQPEGKATATVSTGSICGLETTGVLNKSPPRITISILKDKADKSNIEDFFTCIGLQKKYMSGQFSLDAKAAGVPGRWENGQVALSAENGILKEMSVLPKILTIINVTELFSVDKISRMFSKGYPYSKLNAICEISANRLMFKEAYIKGDGLDFYWKGSIGLSSKEMDLVVYVRPLKTIDSIVTTIPFVGKDLGGEEQVFTLIPIKVQGRIGAPTISYHKDWQLEGEKQYLRRLLKGTIILPSKVIDMINSEKSLSD